MNLKMTEIEISELESLYERIFYRLSDQEKAAHKYWKAETDSFTNFKEVQKDEELKILFAKHIMTLFNAYDQLKNKGIKSGFDDRGRQFVGMHYEATKKLSTAELSKLIKKEIMINFPKSKISVKSDVFSGGSSIDVYVVSPGYNPFTDEFNNWAKKGNDPDAFSEFLRNENGGYHVQNDVYSRRKFKQQYLDDLDKMEKIHSQYNFDNSDSMTDYFHVNYYGHVNTQGTEMYAVFFPENEFVNERLNWRNAYAKKTKAKNEAAKAKRETLPFKKWDAVIYPIRWRGKTEKEDVLVAIIKAPNGLSRMGLKYDVQTLKVPDSDQQIQNYKTYENRNRKYIYDINGQTYIRTGQVFKDVYVESLKPISEDTSTADRTRNIRILKLKYKYAQ